MLCSILGSRLLTTPSAEFGSGRRLRNGVRNFRARDLAGGLTASAEAASPDGSSVLATMAFGVISPLGFSVVTLAPDYSI